jgi:hypothetical protein
MKSFVFKLLGIPVRPQAKTWSAQMGYWLNWLFLILVSAFFVLQVFPQIVFRHEMTVHGITVHSRLPIPSAAPEVLAKAAALVSASELAIPGKNADVFVADEPWVFWLFRPFKSSFAVSVPLTNNIFIADGDFETDIARSRHREFNTRVLSAVIAHEITHGLIVARIGFIDTVRAPGWVIEGYCDYVAREGSFPEQRGLALLASGSTDPSSSFEYFVGRQLVKHLIEQEKMTFEQIAASATQSKELRADVAAQLAKR